jgi:hypothetical protein
MIPDSPFDDDITDPEEFEAALGRLLFAALENGIDLEGSWVYRSNGEGRDLEVMVYELESDED